MDRWYRGYVRWFDNLTGVGFIKVPELERDIKIHYSASENIDKFKNKSWEHRKKAGGEWITYNHLDIVEVQIIFDSHWEQVHKCRKSEWTTKEDILSDALLNYLDGSTESSNSNWDDFILNNILTDIDYINNEKHDSEIKDFY